MAFVHAWVVRTLNRLLMVVVAVVTVMWMLFLLDVNTATQREQRLQYQRAMRMLSTPTPDPDEALFQRLDMRMKQQQQQGQFQPEEQKYGMPPMKAELKKNEAKQPDPVPRQRAEPVAPVAPKEKPQAVAKQQASPKPAPAAKKAAAAKKAPEAKVDENDIAMQDVQPQAQGKVIDAQVLGQYKLTDLNNAPPLPISQYTASSCFCATAKADDPAKISPDDAELLGCPKQENLQMRCLPKFFLAGCNNCGITDLQYRLNKHQLINFGAKKEPDFWTGKFTQKYGVPDDLNHYSQDQYGEATKSVLEALRGGKRVSQPIIGEFAPMLYFSMIGKWGSGGPPVTLPMKRVVPDAKFIFLLRNPIERTIAQYNAIPGSNKSPENFDTGVDTFIKWYTVCTEKKKWDPRNCLYGVANTTEKIRPTKLLIHDMINSIYHIPIKEWIRVFGRENLLILKFEDYMDNRLETIRNKILPFLKLKDYTKGPLQILTEGESDKTLKFETEIKIQMSEASRKKLEAFFKTHNDKLATMLGDTSLLWNS